VSEAGCRASRICRDDGKCSAVGDVCEPATARDCTESANCKKYGLCAFVPHECPNGRLCPANPAAGTCVGSEVGCRASIDCRERGRCAAEGRGCIATAGDCRRSARCAGSGECVLRAGMCVDRFDVVDELL
jgi:hypothetical protein